MEDGFITAKPASAISSASFRFTPDFDNLFDFLAAHNNVTLECDTETIIGIFTVIPINVKRQVVRNINFDEEANAQPGQNLASKFDSFMRTDVKRWLTKHARDALEKIQQCPYEESKTPTRGSAQLKFIKHAQSARPAVPHLSTFEFSLKDTQQFLADNGVDKFLLNIPSLEYFFHFPANSDATVAMKTEPVKIDLAKDPPLLPVSLLVRVFEGGNPKNISSFGQLVRNFNPWPKSKTPVQASTARRATSDDAQTLCDVRMFVRSGARNFITGLAGDMHEIDLVMLQDENSDAVTTNTILQKEGGTNIGVSFAFDKEKLHGSFASVLRFRGDPIFNMAADARIQNSVAVLETSVFKDETIERFYSRSEFEMGGGDPVDDAITDHDAITLTAAGGLELDWSGSGRVTSDGTSTIWILKKCISGDCSAGAIGAASQWTTAHSAASALETCDVVAWYNVASGRLYDCSGDRSYCTSQPFPIPAGHWGSPLKIRRAGTACGEPITKGASGIFFSRMVNSVFDDSAYLQCTGYKCGGTTNGQKTDFTIDTAATSQRATNQVISTHSVRLGGEKVLNISATAGIVDDTDDDMFLKISGTAYDSPFSFSTTTSNPLSDADGKSLMDRMHVNVNSDHFSLAVGTTDGYEVVSDCGSIRQVAKKHALNAVIAGQRLELQYTEPVEDGNYIFSNREHHVNYVRLNDGSSHNNGRLEVLHNDEWGSVCDDNFGSNDAAVVCRQLGYLTALSYQHSYTNYHYMRYYSNPPSRIWMDNVHCNGGESSFTLCAHNGWGSHNCGHSEDIWITCSGSRTVAAPSALCASDAASNSSDGYDSHGSSNGDGYGSSNSYGYHHLGTPSPTPSSSYGSSNGYGYGRRLNSHGSKSCPTYCENYCPGNDATDVYLSWYYQNTDDACCSPGGGVLRGLRYLRFLQRRQQQR
jgi:hypothetical protein